ncbi:MAG: polysaccharide deacetylase family protein [Candidatus Binatia bacterium]
MSPVLHVVMYHYVRDLPNTTFPRIKGMLTQDFCKQVAALAARYEMATLESARDFVHGTYTPARDLCLLTFDDGLKEHYSEVTPLLMKRRIQGIFFVITSCIGGNDIAPVHMNHFLMAALGFVKYRNAFLQRLEDMSPNSINSTAVDPSLARNAYRWDNLEVASFKYMFNFLLDCNARDQILKNLFEEHIAKVESFAETLYVSAQEVKEMQSAGMIIGGHSHQHKPLSSLSDQELRSDLYTCHEILATTLYPQPLWPFCYPYGKKDSFDKRAAKLLEEIGFVCSFSTEKGANCAGADLYSLQRFDCKDMPVQ